MKEKKKRLIELNNIQYYYVVAMWKIKSVSTEQQYTKLRLTYIATNSLAAIISIRYSRLRTWRKKK